MKKIASAFVIVWRSDLRWRVLVDFLSAAAFVLFGVAAIALWDIPSWNAQVNGFWSGIFFGYGIFNFLYALSREKDKADFNSWAQNHVRELMKNAIIGKLEVLGLADDGSPPIQPTDRPTKLN